MGRRGPDPYWQPQAPRRRSLGGVVTAVLVVIAVVAGVGIGRSLPTSTASSPQAAGGINGSGGGFVNPGSPFSGGSSGSIGAGGAAPVAGPANVSGIASKVDSGLVDVNTDLSYNQAQAAGTGIVLTSSGLILTNNHVINGSTAIRITDIGNGRTYTGIVVGYDESADIAVVQLRGASGLATAKLAPASALSIGENVVAIGNAGGKGGTPTAAGGTITALNQAISATDAGDGTTEHLSGLIQTDADVQPGDSGGPLVTSSGLVVGLDTAASQGFSFNTTGAQGFAIPIKKALGLAHQIIAHQASAAVHIGPTAFIGLSFQTTTTNQPVVYRVFAGTPAAGSGVAAGDTITTFDGHPVSSPGTLTRLLVAYHPGDRVALGWTTPTGQSQTATVVLGTGPAA